MSAIQSFILFSVRCTLKVRVLINHPKMILHSDGSPSAQCLVTFMISSRLVASLACGGLNKQSSAKGTEWVILILFSSLSTPAMKISSMKLSAIMSLGGRVTKRGSAGAKGISFGSRLGVVSRKSNRDCREEVSQVGSSARSQARSVALSLMRLNSGGAGLDPNGRRVRM